MNTTDVLILLNLSAVGIGAAMVTTAAVLIRRQVRRGQNASQRLKDFLAAELDLSRPREY